MGEWFWRLGVNQHIDFVDDNAIDDNFHQNYLYQLFEGCRSVAETKQNLIVDIENPMSINGNHGSVARVDFDLIEADEQIKKAKYILVNECVDHT